MSFHLNSTLHWVFGTYWEGIFQCNDSVGNQQVTSAQVWKERRHPEPLAQPLRWLHRRWSKALGWLRWQQWSTGALWRGPENPKEMLHSWFFMHVSYVICMKNMFDILMKQWAANEVPKTPFLTLENARKRPKATSFHWSWSWAPSLQMAGPGLSVVTATKKRGNMLVVLKWRHDDLGLDQHIKRTNSFGYISEISNLLPCNLLFALRCDAATLVDRSRCLLLCAGWG